MSENLVRSETYEYIRETESQLHWFYQVSVSEQPQPEELLRSQ